jgi:hypothetical protein
LSRPALGATQPPVQWYRVFPGVKSGRGVTLTPHSLLVRGRERVELYLYSPYGPYGLYTASVPVQGCNLPFYLYCDGHDVKATCCWRLQSSSIRGLMNGN